MKKIGGNQTAKIQAKTTEKNSMGEGIAAWEDLLTVTGWLDLSSGDSERLTFNTKIRESTHIWFMDYSASVCALNEENVRMLINGKVYEIMLIDDPMGMNQHLEIYLKFTGGQNGS